LSKIYSNFDKLQISRLCSELVERSQLMSTRHYITYIFYGFLVYAIINLPLII